MPCLASIYQLPRFLTYLHQSPSQQPRTTTIIPRRADSVLCEQRLQDSFDSFEEDATILSTSSAFMELIHSYIRFINEVKISAISGVVLVLSLRHRINMSLDLSCSSLKKKYRWRSATLRDILSFYFRKWVFKKWYFCKYKTGRQQIISCAISAFTIKINWDLCTCSGRRRGDSERGIQRRSPPALRKFRRCSGSTISYQIEN